MKLPGYIGVARIALPVVVSLMCLGAFLCTYQLAQPATGMIGSTAPAVKHFSNPGAKMFGGEGALAGKYPTATIEETGADKQRPPNGEYLTALLLTVLLGVSLGLFGGGRMWSRDRGLVLSERRLPSIAGPPPREPACATLSVFLL